MPKLGIPELKRSLALRVPHEYLEEEPILLEVTDPVYYYPDSDRDDTGMCLCQNSRRMMTGTFSLTPPPADRPCPHTAIR